MGDWSCKTLKQLACELITNIDFTGQNQCHLKEVLPDFLSFVHSTSKEEALNLDSSFFITPQQYLELFRQFGDILSKKKRIQDDHQHHIINGLQKIESTLIDVELLRTQLADKEAILNDKNNLANDKLKIMMADQQEAERQKGESIELQNMIINQEEQIRFRKETVLSELAEVEPLVAQAQESVSSIKRQHLQELRTMAHPPEPVKITMESVCIMLGHKVDSWKSVQQISRKDDFIANITNYDTLKLTARIIQEIQNSYINNSSFNFETVNRASKACGPLLQWVIAQVRYASILEKVEPLREEVERLEADAQTTRARAIEMKQLISSLEGRIECLRQEYSNLIAETQRIKYDMDQVTDRICRSLKLLQNLSAEKSRWETSRYIIKSIILGSPMTMNVKH
jgi:dynein heavy chain 1